MLKKLELAQLLQQRIAPDDDISYMTNNLARCLNESATPVRLEIA